MLYRAKVAVWAEINAKHTNTVWAECTVFWMSNLTVHQVTSRFSKVSAYVTKQQQILPLLAVAPVWCIWSYFHYSPAESDRMACSRESEHMAGGDNNRLCLHKHLLPFDNERAQNPQLIFVRQIFSIDYVSTLKSGKCNYLYRDGYNMGGTTLSSRLFWTYKYNAI